MTEKRVPLDTPSVHPEQSPREKALAAFMEYFRTNYPGPDTIISRPDWHAPKVFRAVEYALKDSGLLATVQTSEIEPTNPDTAGSWEARCAALYQVIGALSSMAGIFTISDDVGDALDVAAGRGDVEKLLPWPKDVALFRRVEAHNNGVFEKDVQPDDKPLQPSELRGEARQQYIHEHDCPKVWEFFLRWSAGSKVCPSCLLCGQQRHDPADWKIRHAVLPDIYICNVCVDAARTPTSAIAAPTTPEHVCGLQGYNPMIDPPCPGCEARRPVKR